MLRIAGVYLGLVGEVIRFAPSPLGLLAAPVSVAFAEVRGLRRAFRRQHKRHDEHKKMQGAQHTGSERTLIDVRHRFLSFFRLSMEERATMVDGTVLSVSGRMVNTRR